MFTFPPEIKVALIYFVTEGVKSIFGSISGHAAMIVAAAVAAVLFFGEQVINSLGPDAAAFAGVAATFVLAVLAAFGFNDTVKGLYSTP